MRTEERWQDIILPKVLDRLVSPRLKQDYLYLEIPEVEDYESRFIWSTDKETGKTVYAMRMLLGWEKRAYLNVQPITTKFITLIDLKNELKHSFDCPGESEIDILRKYQQVDVLVLDDVGTTKMSDWMYDILYALINYRYEYLKPTILTTNNTLEQLEEAWQDDRITSRIKRMAIITKKEKYEE